MIRQVMLRAKGCINLGIGEPDHFAPRIVRDEAVRVLEQEKILYSPNAGLPQLCEAIRQYHGGVAEHAVCVTNGSQEAMFDLFFALLDPGDKILIPDPGFVAYDTVARLVGAVPVRYRMPKENGFSFSREEFSRAAASGCKAVLVNSPSNPTGRTVSKQDLEWLAEECGRAGAVLISDEIYREIHYGEQPPSSALEVTDQAVVLSGVSKMASMTGWRIGWACGPSEIIEKTTVAHQYTSSCASTLAQKASLRIFSEAGRKGVESLRQTLQSNQRFACDWLDANLALPWVRPEGAFYIMLSVADLAMDSKTVALSLLEDGVATIPGVAFGAEGEGFLRLSFACQRPALEEGLARLERGVKRLSRA